MVIWVSDAILSRSDMWAQRTCCVGQTVDCKRVGGNLRLESPTGDMNFLSHPPIPKREWGKVWRKFGRNLLPESTQLVRHEGCHFLCSFPHPARKANRSLFAVSERGRGSCKHGLSIALFKASWLDILYLLEWIEFIAVVLHLFHHYHD